MARRALGPATLAATQAVTAVLEPGDRALLVGCSGGADSLALAVAAVVAGARAGLPVAAAVVDHGLQPGSTAVAARAADQLRGLGIEDVVVERVDVRGPGGPEAAARTTRRAALVGRAAERSASVLLGHTRDDQAETVLLGLARGSGARSLAGMAGRSAEAGVDVLRPFLDLPRELTRTVCVEAGLRPWDDPHNTSPDYRRPRVRHGVLPVLEAELGPGVAAALARTAALLRADADLLDELAAQAVPPRPDGHLSCAVAALPTALRTRVLRDWLRSAGAIDLDLTHVAAVDRLLTDWHGQRGVDIPRLRIRRAGRLLVADPAPHP